MEEFIFMFECIAMLLVIVVGLYLISVLLVKSIEKTIVLMNHTIFKEKHIEKLTKEVKEGLAFNTLRINIYNRTTAPCDYSEVDGGICKCCYEDYYLAEGVDEELVKAFKKSEIEALELSQIYFEEERRKDITRRVKFIEDELSEIKKRLKI
nr:MAG TPA: DNA double-strand break repair protein [Caudoviricetes sp.]